MQFQTAKRSNAKLRLGLAGPAGSGKTYSALLLGLSLASHPSKVFVLDSERRSAGLYAHLGPYQVGPLDPPYSPRSYVEAINAAEQAGAEVVIIDSLSHAWSGEGGALEIVDAKSATSKNSYTAWREVTPMHNKLVDALLQSPAHIIVTLRTKVDYSIEKDERTGKMVPRKIGLAPIQREGLDYEFTVFADVSLEHRCMVTKDRTGLFSDNIPFVVDVTTGKKLNAWLTVTPAEIVNPRTGEMVGAKPPASMVDNTHQKPSEPLDDTVNDGGESPDWTFLKAEAQKGPRARQWIEEYALKAFDAKVEDLNDSQLKDVADKVRDLITKKATTQAQGAKVTAQDGAKAAPVDNSSAQGQDVTQAAPETVAKDAEFGASDMPPAGSPYDGKTPRELYDMFMGRKISKAQQERLAYAHGHRPFAKCVEDGVVLRLMLEENDKS